MPTHPTAADLSRQLADNVEAFCRRYLSNGHRNGRWWCVGDVFNTQGVSMYVRLTGSSRGKGARGKWTDGATGEHGDLLDVIRMQNGSDWRHVYAEAPAFLSPPLPPEPEWTRPLSPARDTTGSARRMLRYGRPLAGTVSDLMVAGEGVETVLSVQRVLPAVPHVAALSGAHLGALILPPGLRHLYIARDADRAGEQGAAILRQRAEAVGILVSLLNPREDDFNRDLCHIGPRDLALHLAPQLDPNDAVGYLQFEEALAA